MRIPARSIFFLPVLLLAYLLLPAVPAHAAERKMLGDVTVGKGETAEEASTMWGDVVVEGNVKDDVESGFGNVWIEGPVGGDVDAGSGDVHVNAPVGGDVDVGHGNVYLDSGAQVQGDVSHHNGSLTLYPGGVVSGYQNAKATSSDFGSGSPWGTFSKAIGWIVMPLGLIAAAVLLAVAAPRPLRASARSLEAAPTKSLLLGLISVPAAVLASVLLAITVVGALLLLLLWPAYLALLLFGALVVAYFLGRRIVLATGRYYRAGDALAAAVGALLVWVGYMIPILGGLLFAAVALLGTGAAVLALFGHRPLGPPPPTYASYEEYLRSRGR